MSEKTLLNDRGVLVTSARVRIVATTTTTYQTANISAVTLVEQPHKLRVFTTWFIVFGCAVALLSVNLFSESLAVALAVLGLGIITIGAGVLGSRLLKPTQVIVFSTAGREVEALKTQDRPEADRIINAVNNAIAARG